MAKQFGKQVNEEEAEQARITTAVEQASFADVQETAATVNAQDSLAIRSLPGQQPTTIQGPPIPVEALFAVPDPQRQDLAVAHAAWTFNSTGTYDPGKSLAFAYSMDAAIKENPELYDVLLGSDLATGLAAIELDQLIGHSGFNLSLKDKLLAASNDQLESLRHRLMTSEDILRQTMIHSERRDQLNASPELRRSATAGDGPFLETEQIAGNEPFDFIDPQLKWLEEVSDQGFEAIQHGAVSPMAGVFLENIRGKQFEWVPLDGRLVARITTPGPHGSETLSIFDVKLDGEIGNTSGDAITAILEALWGQAHELTQADDVPGGQNILGAMVEFLGDVTDPVFESGWVDRGINNALRGEWRSTAEFDRDAILQQADQQILAGLNPDDVMVAGIAGMSADNGMYFGIAQGSREWFDDMSPEEQEAIREQITQLPSRDEIVAGLEGLEDDRHAGKRFLDAAAEQMLGAFETYERFVQGNFISVVDFFADLGEGALEASGLMFTENEGNFADKFISAFEWEHGSAAYRGELQAADYFGLDEDSEYRGLVNLGASLAGDLFTWTAVSGIRRAGEMTRIFSDSSGAAQREWIQTPTGHGWMQQIRGYAGGGNDAALFALTYGTGISNEGLDALRRAATAADVDKIFIRETTEGSMIPTLTGGLRFRNSAQWVARMSSKGDSQSVREFLRHMVGQYRSERMLNFGAARYRGQMGEELLARSTVGMWGQEPAEFSRWLDEMLSVSSATDDVTRKYLGLRMEENAYNIEIHNTNGDAERRFLRGEAQARHAGAREREMRIHLDRMKGESLDPEAVDEIVEDAIQRHVREQTASSQAALDDAIFLAEHQDDIAALERRIELLDNGPELRAQAARKVVDADDALTPEQATRADEIDARLTEIEQERVALVDPEGNVLDEAADFQLVNERGELTNELDEIVPARTAAQAEGRALRKEMEEVGASYPDGLKPGTPEFAEAAATARRWAEQNGALLQERAGLRGLKHRADVFGDGAVKADFHRRFWEDWGREVFDVADDTKLEDMPWHLINGEDPAVMRTRLTQNLGEEVVARLNIGEEVSAGLLDELARGLSPQIRGAAQSPVSVMQMVAYQARQSDAAWLRWMIPNPARRDWLSKLSDGIRTAFAFNVLMNPFTWIRSNLDEPLRHVLQRGIKTRTSAQGRRIPGGVETGARRLEASFGGEAGMDDLTNLFARPMSKPYAPIGDEIPWLARTKEAAKKVDNAATKVKRGEFLSSAQNLFNGVWPKQPMWEAYGRARHLGDDALFDVFWNQGGKRQAGVRVSGKGYADMYPDEMLSGLDGVVGYFAKQTNDPEAFTAAFHRVLATGEEIPDSLLRQLDTIPASMSRPEGVVDSSFHWLFGRPAEVHSGHVGKDFYAQTEDILYSRHGDRVLTAERLAEIEDLPLEMAQTKLKEGSDIVERLVTRHGYVTEKSIHVQAEQVARIHADHMAYSMGASTFGGQILGKAFPFLRAQMDFLGYYYRELRNSTAFGFSPKVSRVLKRPGIIDSGLPLNLRLASRIGDFGGALSTVTDSETDLLKNLIDEYTFLPASFDESLWLQLEPGAGPVPAWLLHMLPLEGENAPASLRRFLEAVYPAFGFDERVLSISDIPNLAQGALSFIAPDSSRSLTRAVTSLGRGLIGLTGSGDTRLGLPPGYQTDMRNYWADALAENPWRPIVGTEFTDLQTQISQDAWNSSARGQGGKWLKGAIPVVREFLLDADQGEFLHAYTGFVANTSAANMNPAVRQGDPVTWGVTDLYRFGYVGDAQYDTIRDLWTKLEDDTIVFDEVATLADHLKSVLFELPDNIQNLVVVYHPELAMNLVSTWRVKPGTEVPDDVNVIGDRVVYPPGEPGQELFERLKREQILTRRDSDDIGALAYARFAQAATGLRNQAWTAATGLEVYQPFPALADEKVSTRRADIFLSALGIDPTGITTRRQLADALNARTDPVRENRPPLGASYPTPSPLREIIKSARNNIERAGGDPDDTSTWDIPSLDYIRSQFEPWLTVPVDMGGIPIKDYNTFFAPTWGPIDDIQIDPPDLQKVPLGTTENTFRMTVPAGLIGVIDGDTVTVPFFTEDAASWMGDQSSLDEQRIRLIGINAAEKNLYADQVAGESNQLADHQIQTEALEELLANATTIDFVVFAPEKFAVLQQIDGDEVRWLMVMYADGKPLWDPNVFNFRNPTGAATGGRGVLDVLE